MKSYLDRFYRESEYPALMDQFVRWREQRPFEGVRILDATPLFRNTLAKYLPLLAGGADLTVGICDEIPHCCETAGFLRAHGVNVVKNPAGEFDIVLDCAAMNAGAAAKIGYVELTRSGVAGYMNSPKPVLSADDSRIKVIETALGTGDGFLRAMRHLGHDGFAGSKVVVFGCGKVGRGVAMYARRAGAQVVIVDDLQKVALPEFASGVDLNDSAAIESALCGAWCVVSVTGVKNAWAGRFDPAELLASEALIVNMGCEDEFGPGVPEPRVLNRKKPLNFILEEPTRLKYIEATLALHNQAAELLLSGGFAPGMNPVPAETVRAILDCSVKNGEIGAEIRELGLYE